MTTPTVSGSPSDPEIPPAPPVTELIKRLKKLSGYQAGYVWLRTGIMEESTNKEIVLKLNDILKKDYDDGYFHSHVQPDIIENLGLKEFDYRAGRGKKTQRNLVMEAWYKPVFNQLMISPSNLLNWPDSVPWERVAPPVEEPPVQQPLPVQPPVYTPPPPPPPPTQPPVSTHTQTPPSPPPQVSTYTSTPITTPKPSSGIYPVYPTRTPIRMDVVSPFRGLVRGISKAVVFLVKWSFRLALLYVITCWAIIYALPHATFVYPYKDLVLYSWFYKIYPEWWPYDYPGGVTDTWMFAHLAYDPIVVTPNPAYERPSPPRGYIYDGPINVAHYCETNKLGTAADYNHKWSCTSLKRTLRQSELNQACALTRMRGEYYAGRVNPYDMYSTRCFKKTAKSAPTPDMPILQQVPQADIFGQ